MGNYNEVNIPRRRVVVDVMFVVDLAREFAGESTNRRMGLKKLFVARRHDNPVLAEGELVRVNIALSHHIVDTATKVLCRKYRYDPARAKRYVEEASDAFTGIGPGGHYDSAPENREKLGRRVWSRYATNSEDEAVLRFAEDNHAAILTDDINFRRYLGTRGVACWSLEEFLRLVQ